jgi:6-pyruvoyltetrahydropterin/6-carboxytetrahydropterin synthase
MLELYSRFDFAAARRLPALPATHPCHHLHGHTFEVEIVLRGEPQPGFDWLIDFGEVEHAVEQLKGELDHRYLNDIEGLANPTSEVIARWVWRRLKPMFSLLDRVTVTEHPSRGVTYCEPAA